MHALHRPALAALPLALLCALASPAHAITATLYEGLGYDIVEVSPGNLGPVGYVNPVMSYVLPGATSGGTPSAGSIGVGGAQLSTGTAFLGQRGMVITANGSYALGTLGVNSVAGWQAPGFGSSSAMAAAADGSIVGSSTLYSADGTQELGGRAVYWAKGTSTPQQLALSAEFTSTSGYAISSAYGISSTGIIIGSAQQYNGEASLGTRAIRWSSAAATGEVLGSLPGYSQWGENTSSAVAVNAAGTVVGRGNTFDASGNLLGNAAIRWDAGTTTATALGHLGTAKDGTYRPPPWA